MECAESIQYKPGMAFALHNIGFVYYGKDNLIKAKKYFSDALEIRREIKDQNNLGVTSALMGEVNRKLGNESEAIEYGLESYELRKKIGDRHGISVSTVYLGDLYLELGHKLGLSERERILKAEELHQQNEEIVSQRDQLEEIHKDLSIHHKEISDSINYTKRIQSVVMPSLEQVKLSQRDCFVYFNPNETVAGDFYWMENNEENGIKEKYVAVADCTGHGVPGAIMSMICSSTLSKALLEEGLRNTGEILDRTREIVIESLAKSGEDVHDGMDISFCRLHLFNYINLMKFLENPEKDWLKEFDSQLQLKFSSS